MCCLPLRRLMMACGLVGLIGFVLVSGLTVPRAAASSAESARATLLAAPDDVELWRETLESLFVDGAQAENFETAMRIYRELSELAVERLAIDAARGTLPEASAAIGQLMNVHFGELLQYYPDDATLYALGENALEAYRTMKPRGFMGAAAQGMLTAVMAEHTKDSTARRLLFDEAHTILRSASEQARCGRDKQFFGVQADLLRLNAYRNDAQMSPGGTNAARKKHLYAEGETILAALDKDRAALDGNNTAAALNVKVQYAYATARFCMAQALDSATDAEREALLEKAMARLETLHEFFQNEHFFERAEMAAIRGDARECLALLRQVPPVSLASYGSIGFYAANSPFIRLVADDPELAAFLRDTP
ncbi:hypothetical protein LJC23_05505 [Desulfovibrio sp. OttesenSCG-928-I05]|nr:hypothetical protein [Desulfovibrio sp. OttesenSCG-928-I05]